MAKMISTNTEAHVLPGWRHLRSLLVASLIAFSAPANAAPAWWTARGVVDSQFDADDYAVLNVGQLKHMAAKARDELNAVLPGGAGSAIDTLVNGWATATNADDYAVCNVGQLKAVAKLYWDQLTAVSGATAHPWTALTSDDDDYAVANLGQLKTVFNFDSDMDDDGLPDWREVQYAGSLAVLTGDGVHDQDGDNISDLTEYQIGWNPVLSEINDTARTESLSYDGAHRLTTVSGRSTLGYTPDASGNLVQTTNP